MVSVDLPDMAESSPSDRRFGAGRGEVPSATPPCEARFTLPERLLAGEEPAGSDPLDGMVRKGMSREA